MKTLAILFAMLPALAIPEAQRVGARCDDGILTIRFPEAVVSVSIDYGVIHKLCTRPA